MNVMLTVKVKNNALTRAKSAHTKCLVYLTHSADLIYKCKNSALGLTHDD